MIKYFILFFYSTTVFSQIKVGIVDSGIDKNHPLFKGVKINESIILGNSIEDNLGHGTHVAGIFNKYSGSKKLTMIKNITKSENLSAKDLFKNPDNSVSLKDFGYSEVIDFAIKEKISILNISQVTNNWTQSLYDTFKKAEDHGILIVAAAGNDLMDLSFFDKYPELKKSNIYPCSLPFKNIICVGSIDSSGVIKSNYSEKYVDVFALGENVVSSLPNGKYGAFSGSSMATPKITAAAFKIWQKNPNLTAFEVKNKVIGSLTYNQRFKKVSVSSRFFKE